MTPVRIAERAALVGADGPVQEVRPAEVPSGVWRRMSHLSRLVAMVATDLLGRAPEIDRAALATVWATAFGEIVTTSRYLERMFQEGPEVVSPAAFQTSVYGTPMAHLSIALGLTGHSETISAVGASSALALMRGIDLIRGGTAPAALVLAGDDVCDTVTRAAELAGRETTLSEAVAGVLLLPGDGPRRVEVVPGRQLLAPVLEGPTVPAGGLALLARLDEGSVVETDCGSVWTIRVRA